MKRAILAVSLLLFVFISVNSFSQDLDSIYIVCDDSPGFPGGDEPRLKFLQKNIKYPQMAREMGIQGKVFVTFVIEKDGSLTNAKILRGIGGGCDEEIIRIVSIMPKWEPGIKDGKVVRTQFNMPVKFTLSGESEKSVFPESPNKLEFVNDFAKTFSDNQKEELYKQLLKIKKEKGIKIIIVSVKSTGSYNIGEYSYELSKIWGLEEKENTVLLLYCNAKSKYSRKMYIATSINDKNDYISDEEAHKIYKEIEFNKLNSKKLINEMIIVLNQLSKKL